MEINRVIETGNKLELQKIRHVEFSEEKKYVSRFLYQKNANEAVIEMPSYQGVLVPLEIDDEYTVCFFTNKGLYRCEVIISDRFYEDKLPVAAVKFRSEFEKLQRRQYYRMECLLDLNYRVVTKEETEQILWEKKYPNATKMRSEEDNTRNNRFHSGVALDISGGGIRFNSEVPAESGKIIAIQVAILAPQSRSLKTLFAKILTCTPVSNRNGLFEHRAEFVLITNDERESIIRYIFMEERNRRKSNN